jgi:hypothetical protein
MPMQKTQWNIQNIGYYIDSWNDRTWFIHYGKWNNQCP